MPWVRTPALLFLSLFLAAAAAPSRADDPLDLPKVFDKTVPETAKDLDDIERHVKKLVEKVTPCTVGLRIGGSSGSGVIVSKDGIILTAGHVSGKADQDVQIILYDGKKLKGKSLGSNRGIDSGMVKITDKGEWPYADMAFGDVKKGNWCLALGHPKGYFVGRSPPVRLGRILEVHKDFLRTDCTLVGGDSGGPLFDMYGQVIGIHSRIGGPITANIHVPISTYHETWDRLVAAEVWGDALFGPKKGGPKNAGGAYLGVRTVLQGKELRIDLVAPDSPAERGGLKADDIMLSIDGAKIGTMEDFDNAMRSKQPGAVVTVQVRRGTEILSKQVTLGKRADKSNDQKS